MMSLTGTPATAYKRWLQAIWVAPRDSRPKRGMESFIFCEQLIWVVPREGEARPKGIASLNFL